MGKVIVFNNVTLDGVMQAPGRPEEDRRNHFAHGGWATRYATMDADGPGMSNTPLLLGRRTYEDFYTVWPNRTDGNPFTSVLNNTQKYVASTTLQEPLVWGNSTLLKDDVAAAVATLKQELTTDLVILGSGVLIQSLMRNDLIDRYVLHIHPLVLGSGRRLFPADGPFATLQLVDTKTTTSGVVVVTYQIADAATSK